MHQRGRALSVLNKISRLSISTVLRRSLSDTGISLRSPNMKYITADELAELMKSEDKVPKKDYLVVDVRDDDFVGGNIKGAVNKPSNEFLMNVGELVTDAKEVKMVVFHCAMSQVRGPKAARIYQETRRHVLQDVDTTVPPEQEVMVLREGFSSFQSKFRDDPLLVENFDKDFWH